MTPLLDVGPFAAWLGAREVVVEGAPGGGGWSNETVFVRADRRPLVVRLAPPGPSMFPSYDLVRQVRCLRLAREHGLPVPEVVGAEFGADVLGRPFFVMERLAGRVPADDDPPFTTHGFLFDASRAEQATFCCDALDRIASVHEVAAPPFLAPGPAPADHVGWCAQLCRWAGVDHPGVWAAHDALAADAPPAKAAPASLLWGDARPANMVVDERFRVVGLLDWELAGVGPGEFDVAWFCEMNHLRTRGAGVAPLPGFLDVASTWERWSARSGRTPTSVDWHHRYAAYKVAVLLFLYLRTMIARGRLPAGHRVLEHNVGTRRLLELFG